MAIWQFTIELVPRTWSLRFDAKSSDLLSANGREMSVAWKDNQLKVDVEHIIKNFFPIARSWCPELRCWGNEKETDLQVFYENESVESITARVDARTEVGVVCLKIVDISNALDCVLYLPEMNSIIEPTVIGITRAISQSRAAKFAANPHSFFDELQRSSQTN